MTIFRGLGYEVSLCGAGESFEGEDFDVLVALNAKKSHDSIEAFKTMNPQGRVIVVLTGTDIYPEVGARALKSMAKADRMVALQGKALEMVPVEMREKVRVILQASEARESGEASCEFFEVAVVGHFREVKDPMQTATAVRLLPEISRIRVRQAGAILEDKYEELIQKELAENPRYEWLGELPPAEAAMLIADSDLLVVSSFSEGAPRVVGEAVVSGTPVLSSRIDGVEGLLGVEYPGYFPVGGTEELSRLIWKAENDSDFYHELKQGCDKVASTFLPKAEEVAWSELLEEMLAGKE